MYLKSLTLKGFKSFAKKTTLDFEPGISCVVGPNGSGKSNISDAILWVLGERSAKNIRGESMQDVIFAGTKNKSRAAMAEVSLCLDNSDGTLNIDYSQVEITRRMYRSGESDYWLNDAPVRRLDVLNILHDSGLGEGTHSIISQGSLDSVLSFDEMQLKCIIEEVAGILKDKQKKEKSMRKLDSMQANFDRINDVTTEIERQLVPLRRRAKKADTYLEIKDDLMRANLELAVDDYRRSTKSKQDVASNITNLDLCLKSLDEDISKINVQITELTEQIKTENEIRGKQSGEFKKYNELLSRLESVLMLLDQSLDQTRDESQRISRDAQSACVELAVLQKKQTDTIKNYEEANERKDKLAQKVSEVQTGLDEVNQKKACFDKDISQVKEKQSMHTKQVRLLQEQISRAIAEMEGKKARLQFLNEKKDSLEKKISSLRKILNSQKTNIDQLSDLQESLRQGDESAKQVVISCNKAKIAAEEALSKARIEQDSCQAQLKALEKISKSQDVSSSVSRFVDSSNSLTENNYLFKQIHVEKGYESLCEGLLSKLTDSLTVSSLDEALQVLRELPQNADFGLSLIAPKSVSVHADCEKCDKLTCHISGNDAVMQIINCLLGNVFVCESIEDCIVKSRLNENLTFATKECDVVWANGVVSFSSKSAAHDNGILHRARQIEDIKTALKESEKCVCELTEKARIAASALGDAQANSLSYSQKLAEVKAKLDASKSDYKNKSKELEDTIETLGDLNKEIADSETVVLKTDDIDILRDELSREGELESSANSEMSRLMAARDALADDISEFNSQLNIHKPELAVLDERCTYYSRLQSSQKLREHTLNKRISHLEREKRGVGFRAANIQGMIKILSNLESTFRNKAHLFDFNDPKNEEHISSLFSRLSDWRNEVAAKTDKKDECFEKISANRVELTKINIALESATERIESNFEGSLMDALSMPELQNRDEVESVANELNTKMAKLGSIDLAARADYEALQDRFDFMNSNLEDIKVSISAIEKINALIEKRFKEQFEKTFDNVNRNFKKVFTELFPGGFGELTLTNPENIDESGVLISANPAGKRIKKISLLSGGEKSLVALSFLFALYSTRHTPFYVLDEVEAALDDTNLSRMLSYIDNMREETQFIFITHQRRTMEMADVLFGVSMQEDGITKVISQKLSAFALNDE